MADTNRIISVQGAREHNLKNVSIELPRDALIVFTGLSGSGKSSLAFDTIYAEGQRRYVESLSAYARQFLEMMQKPDVDQIDGLSPAISIEQKTTSRNPRSTVGTVTEIYDYMRLLLGPRRHCLFAGHRPADREPDRQPDGRPGDGAAEEGTRLYLLAPIVRAQGRVQEGVAELMKQGFQRVKVDGAFTRLPTCPRSTRSTSTTSTWWWTASWCAMISRRASPTVSRPR
jgi:excinuclease ABC subunit A